MFVFGLIRVDSENSWLKYSPIGHQGTPAPWRPKPQPRSGVSAGCKGGFAARVGRLRRSAPTLGFFDGRCRADYAFGAPFVPNGRVGSPQRTQTPGAQRRLRGACELRESALHSTANTKQWRLQPMRCASQGRLAKSWTAKSFLSQKQIFRQD
jgi:hypothetical protein